MNQFLVNLLQGFSQIMEITELLKKCFLDSTCVIVFVTLLCTLLIVHA